jgi:niacin transporter
MIRTRILALAALLIAAGIALGILAHTLGVAGQVLLPLHYPPLIGGLLLGWRWGAIIGVMTPLLSAFLTGMPPLIPSALLMIPEAAVYGAVSGALRKRIGLYPALICALILGRIAWAGGVWLLTPVLGLHISPLASAGVATLTGLPGIIGQIILAPIIVTRLEGILR